MHDTQAADELTPRPDSGTLLCLLPGPSYVYRTEPDTRQTRWCFTCRQHRPHVLQLVGDPPPPLWVVAALADEGLDGYTVQVLMGHFSYYDPTWSLRCPAGHSDIYFPGCEPW